MREVGVSVNRAWTIAVLYGLAEYDPEADALHYDGPHLYEVRPPAVCDAECEVTLPPRRTTRRSLRLT